jgi:hypothetical protein
MPRYAPGPLGDLVAIIDGGRTGKTTLLDMSRITCAITLTWGFSPQNEGVNQHEKAAPHINHKQAGLAGHFCLIGHLQHNPRCRGTALGWGINRQAW